MGNEEKILELLEKQGETLKRHEELLEKQREILEKHGEVLKRLQEDQSEMRETLTRVAITQENVVLPRLSLLAEGHKALLETLAPKNRVEALEDDIALLKSVIKSMSQRLNDLEKAQ